MRHDDGLPAAFVETKDIGDTDLDGRSQHREQFGRYRDSLDHIVFTDYLDFHFYEGGQLTDTIRLGELRGDKVTACKDALPPLAGGNGAHGRGGAAANSLSRAAGRGHGGQGVPARRHNAQVD